MFDNAILGVLMGTSLSQLMSLLLELSSESIQNWIRTMWSVYFVSQGRSLSLSPSLFPHHYTHLHTSRFHPQHHLLKFGFPDRWIVGWVGGG